MRLYLSCVILLMFGTVRSQSEADSLLYLIEHSNTDTNRIKTMLDLAYLYEIDQRDHAIEMYDHAFKEADKLGSDIYRGKAIQYKSIVLHVMGKYAESIVGNQKALYYFERADYVKGISSTYNNIGNSYLYLADYHNALKYYLLAKPFYESQKDWLSLVTILGNMGECYRQLNDKENMMTVAKASYEYALLTHDSLEIANAGISLGSAFTLNQQPEKSNFYLEQSLRLAESMHNNQVLFYALFDLADAKLKSGKAMEALPLAQRTLEVAKSSADDYLISGACLLQGRILTALNNRYHEALDILETGLQLATKIEAADQRLLLIAAIADVYESSGDTPQALAFQKKWIALNDSIFNAEKARQINEMHTLYELEEKEQQIENEKLLVAEKDKKISQRNLQIWIVFFLALIVGLIALFISKSQRNRRILAEQKATVLEKEKAAVQLKSLIDGQEEERKRIARELHDGLGGYLTSVHLKTQQLQKNPNDERLMYEVSEMVTTAGKEMRKISHAMAPEGLMKLGLVPTLQQFVEKVSTPQCQISFEYFGEPWSSDDYSEITVYRVVQELINNILKHSLADEAFVSISFLPEEIKIVVEDDGIGFENEDLVHAGNGLQNVKARVTYLNASLHLFTRESIGTSYTIHIPKRDDQN
ncbi:MAG: tetratricopeptide repeat protein [Flavobacteriales bacterium]|nr:tetratricopeptide repeat protein [Flavobacteriales bacterium]